MNNNLSSSVAKALDHYQTADYLFRTTFPFTKDPKLLPAIVKSISNCLEYILEAILAQEKISVPEGLLKKINAVRPYTGKHFSSVHDITLMLRIHEILYRQQQSPMEFKRGNSHIICSENYDLEVLSIKEVEELLQWTKKVLYLFKSTKND